MENTHVSIDVKKNIKQFILFSMVGVLNTLISEGIYGFLTYFGMHYVPASLIGFVISVLNAYFWNDRIVFKAEPGKESRVWWKSLYKTYVAYVGGYFLNVVLLVFWMDIVRLERWLSAPAQWFLQEGYPRADAEFLAGILAAAINLLVTGPINYLINKYWAFHQKHVKERLNRQ